MHLRFPTQGRFWNSANGEYGVGRDLLYYSGNDADSILLYSRLPILLLTIGFGAVLFTFARKRYGELVAAVAVVFYAFSPNVLAHGRLATLDMGASIFIFLALMAAGRFLHRPTVVRVVVLGVALAAAILSKYTAVLLYPFLLLAAAVAILATGDQPLRRRVLRMGGGALGAIFVSAVISYLVYVPLTRNSPASILHIQVQHYLSPQYSGWLLPMFGHWGTTPLITLLYGVFKSIDRSNSLNTLSYYDGHVTRGGNLGFFPLTFVLKTQVALLILMAAMPTAALVSLAHRHRRFDRQALAAWARRHSDTLLLAGFCVTYFVVAMAGNLNIGLRHILPIYPPLFVLVAAATGRLLRLVRARRRAALPAVAASFGLLSWYVGSGVSAYPSYLPYLNEIAGGPANAAAWFADSNVDWGQDLKRLRGYLDGHPEMNSVAVDYFGSGDIDYYFCRALKTLPTTYDCAHSRVVPWRVVDGPYPGQYIAVSETYLNEPQLERPYFPDRPMTYDYLKRRQPIARIGYSIYLYKLR